MSSDVDMKSNQLLKEEWHSRLAPGITPEGVPLALKEMSRVFPDSTLSRTPQPDKRKDKLQAVLRVLADVVSSGSYGYNTAIKLLDRLEAIEREET